ncbi:MAG: hypothetical protein R6X19_07220 [Kiritimatiellia bacterium]
MSTTRTTLKKRIAELAGQLTVQEARLLVLIMGLLLLGLSVRFYHLRRETSRVIERETGPVAAERSRNT